MISKIDISQFGIFKQYAWDSSLGREATFKRLNIIYGRNYSGKTTISRILGCVQDKKKHEDYANAIFSIQLEDGTKIISSELDGCDLQVRVYNTDFVKKHLGWMYDHNGEIEPFTILGSYNVELDHKIKELDITIGSIDGQTGLTFYNQGLLNERKNSEKNYNSLKSALTEKLTQKAKEIKENTHKFDSLTYSKTHLEKEIASVSENNILEDESKEELVKLIKEEPKNNINTISEFPDNFNVYLSTTNRLISQKITLNEPIAELLQDAILQEWVRSGRSLHANKEKCAFCGNDLSKELWDKLDKHFNTESENLRRTIAQAIEEIDTDLKYIDMYAPPSEGLFYDKQAVDISLLSRELKIALDAHVKNLLLLKNALTKRFESIFDEQDQVNTINIIPDINGFINKINSVIKLNNELRDSLAQRQKDAKAKLRLSEVAHYKRDIKYDDALDALTVAEKDLITRSTTLSESQANLERAFEERRSLKNQAQDKSKGAELVNQLLSHYFGHDGLKLEAIGEHPQIVFRIMRGNELAKNLSEGECSLIAFCYFIARMQDELKSVGTDNNLIICIDDPVSSLDHNHIFFMFGMIESVLCKDKNYKQLFILTHNLELLKYLRQLTQPEKKIQTQHGTTKKIKDFGMFLIERESLTMSKLKSMPKYMHDYITEFNYLFEQVYNTSQQQGDTTEFSYHYNFGNNLRKFLEAYLFYKYPDHGLKLSARLDHFFGDDSIGKATVQRFIHDYSHLESHPDRGISPILPQDAKNIALLILDKMKGNDEEQFEHLLKSIGVTANQNENIPN